MTSRDHQIWKSSKAGFVPKIWALVFPGLLLTTVGSSQGVSGNAERYYRIVDLGLDQPAIAVAVNDSGEVVIDGNSTYVWQEGRLRKLPPIPPKAYEDRSGAVGYAISRDGTVVGASGSFIPGPNDGLRLSAACEWRRGSVRELLSLPDDQAHEGEAAYGINGLGDVVGIRRFMGFAITGKGRFSVPPMSSLGEGNGTVATAVNDRGDIVGASTITTSGPYLTTRAFLWRKPYGDPPVNLGTIGDHDSIALAVNQSDAVVGYTSRGTNDSDVASGRWIGNRDPRSLVFDQLPPNGRAFIWESGSMRELVGLSARGTSIAYAINDDGTVAGVSNDKAVVWRRRRALDLNRLISDHRWRLVEARGINDQGWIVGRGLKEGRERAFLLVPD